jgi:hypothetical protein
MVQTTAVTPETGESRARRRIAACQGVRMRMSFSPDDETAYRRQRATLSDDFAGWAERHRVDADPSDVELLLDWKVGYGDGHLGRWTVPDINEFLLEWCPRKLASPIDMCAEIPVSIAAFFDFLAHSGLLAPGSQPPSALRKHCHKITPEFLREMTDSNNFGLAKSLLGGLDEFDDAELSEQLQRLTGLDPTQLAELVNGTGSEPIGPVRLPTTAAHLESLRAAPTFQQVRALAERCAETGLPVTAKGNPRLADARRLVIELNTGDEADPTRRAVRSTAELPALSWVIEVAVEAGAVTVADGRMTADPEFGQLTDPQAYLAVVSAAIGLGLATGRRADRADEEVFLDDAGPHLLATLLTAHADDRELMTVDDLTDMVTSVADVVLGGHDAAALATGMRHRIDRLAGLGVLRRGGPDDDDDQVRLTPAGVQVAADLVAELLDTTVIVRPDPITASAAELAAVLPSVQRGEAEADLAAWFDAQPDPIAAATTLVAELAHPDRTAADVITSLELAGAVLGEPAETAARAHLGGPHDLLIVSWLLVRGVLDPAEVEPERALNGMVEVAAAMIDVDGPRGAVEFCLDTERTEVLALLDQFWRLDHPRVGEVLDCLGRHHPDRVIAKAARKNLMRHRNRIAQ